MSYRTIKKTPGNPVPAGRKFSRKEKVDMIEDRRGYARKLRISDLARRGWWSLVVMTKKVYKKLDAALDGFEKLDVIVARGSGSREAKKSAREEIRGLALEFRLMGTRYNFGVSRILKELHEAERFLGGCRYDLEGLANSEFNSTENCPEGSGIEGELLSRVKRGRKPAATIRKEFEDEAGKAGLLVCREEPDIHVSKHNPIAYYYTEEFIMKNFSALHPLVTDSLVRTFRKNRGAAAAEWLKGRKVLDRSGRVAHVVDYIMRSLLYGRPVNEIYEGAHKRLFFASNRNFLEPMPMFAGEKEAYRGIYFKRYLGPKKVE